MTTITTKTDISTWVSNENPHAYQTCGNASAVHGAIVEALRRGDHPAWGDDWSEYLDSFDYASVVDPIAGKAWDFEGYWNAVLGANRKPADVVREFELDGADRRGLDEWLGTAEAEAWAVGGQGGDLPEEWAAHHDKALAALESVATAVRS